MIQSQRSGGLAFPAAGMAVGAGLLVSECAVVVRGFMTAFGAGGIWKELGTILAAYVLAGAITDLATQALLPARWKQNVVLRSAPLLILAFAAERAFGMATVLPILAVPLAAGWALLWRVRWCLPLAAGIAMWALSPAFPREARPPAELAASAAKGPSFVVVVLDTVRRDHCSLYGYARTTTPNLDQLAARGVRFDRAYTTSCWSIPTHASLFTGLLPSRHGACFEHFHFDDGPGRLPSILAELGYETVGFTGNPYISTGTGFASGFTRFEELWRPAVLRRLLVAEQLRARLLAGEGDKGGAAILDGVRGWFRTRDRSRPYFLFVNFMEAHAPYQDVPSRFRQAFAGSSQNASEAERIGYLSHEAQWLGTRVPPESLPGTLDLLDGATAAADHYLGALLEVVGDDPIVVVLSDHGDLVGEHDLFGHMTSLYEPLIRIPLVMAGPALPKGRAIQDLVSVVDVMPTFLLMAGAPLTSVDGIDLRPVISGTAALEGRVVRAEHSRTTQATRMWSFNRTPEEMAWILARRAAAVGGDHKRVVSEGGEDLAYDLKVDPGEERSLPGTVVALAVEVPRPMRRASRSAETLDPVQIEALRSLGYVH